MNITSNNTKKNN